MTDRILSVVSLLVALGSVAYAYQSKKSEPKVRETRPPVETTQMTPDEELEGRVTALEWVISGLSRRLETVETMASRQPMPQMVAQQQAAPIPGDVGQRIQRLEKDVEALFAASVLDTEHGRERAKEALRDLQNELAMDRMREREQVMAQARQERFQRFAQEARLTPVQQQRLQSVLDNEQNERRALFERMQAGGGNRSDIGREMMALRERTDAEARKILSDQEYEQYQAMRREEFGRRGGQGGRGQGGGQWQGRGQSQGQGSGWQGGGQGQGEGAGWQGAGQGPGRGEGRGNRQRGGGQEGQGRRGGQAQ